MEMGKSFVMSKAEKKSFQCQALNDLCLSVDHSHIMIDVASEAGA